MSFSQQKILVFLLLHVGQNDPQCTSLKTRTCELFDPRAAEGSKLYLKGGGRRKSWVFISISKYWKPWSGNILNRFSLLFALFFIADSSFTLFHIYSFFIFLQSNYCILWPEWFDILMFKVSQSGIVCYIIWICNSYTVHIQ